MNVTAHELAATPAVLKKASRRWRLPLVSTSVVDAKSGKPVFEPVVVRRVGGLKIAFIGAISTTPPGYQKLFLERGLEVIEADEAVRRGVAAARAAGADVVVLLSGLKRLQIDRVLEQVEGVDVAIGSDSHGLSTELEVAGKSYFVDTFSKGKYIGELRLTPGKAGAGYVAADRSAGLRAHAAMLSQQIAALRGTLAETGERAPTPATRRALEAELARMLAQHGQTQLELSEPTRVDADAGVLELAAHPIDKTIADDARVLQWVDAYKAVYPSTPSH